MLDDVTWDVDVRAAGSDTIVPVIHTTESATAPAKPTAAPAGSQPPPVRQRTAASPEATPEPETKGPATEPGGGKAPQAATERPGGAAHVQAEPEGGGVEPQGEGDAPGVEGGMTPEAAAEGGAVWAEQKGIEGYEALQEERAEAEFKRYEPEARRRAAQGDWVVLKAWFIEAPPNMVGSVAKERLDAREFSEVTVHVGSTKDEAFGNPATTMEEAKFRPEDAPPVTTQPKGYKSSVRLTKVFEPDPEVEKLIAGDADFIGTYHPSKLDQQGGDITPLQDKGWHRELKLKAGVVSRSEVGRPDVDSRRQG